ncbi:MAG: DUF1573 domain-containing protein [Bacteroidota bacterium]|nr:DUF1573 domain-containing protein [Bacteroidota bacterium]
MNRILKIGFIWCMALILMSSVCEAQNQKQDEREAKESIVEEVCAKFDKNYYDFGQIKRGEDGEVVFELENVGGGLLNITSVKTSCGCVLVDYSRQGLMHNEKGYIKVRYNTNVIGEIKRSVIVSTNDKNNSKVVLRLIGKII